MATVATKPSYLGLLNVIALAETRAHEYLVVWAAATPSEDVRKVLLTVAAREGEHGMTFAKRINELGYELVERDDPGFAKKLEIARSNMTDLEKMEALAGDTLTCDDSAGDVFDGFFKDQTIDIRTGE